MGDVGGGEGAKGYDTITVVMVLKARKRGTVD